MATSFTDDDNKTHTLVFDEVVGYQPAPGADGLFQVSRKAFPRKLDGFDWNSEELDKQDLPVNVYSSMWDCIMNCKDRRKRKGLVEMSCHIACADGIHQGQFHTVAEHGSPLVFNNACWSWSEVAAFFLDGGARGYIGTLWAIDNQDAVQAAEIFYGKLFNSSVSHALKDALDGIRNTQSKDIYVYWGLHFTRFKVGTGSESSKRRVRMQLMESAFRWAGKITSTQSAEIKRNSEKVLESVLQELRVNLAADDTAEFERTVRRVTGLDAAVRRDSVQASLGTTSARRDSVYFETEIRGRKIDSV